MKMESLGRGLKALYCMEVNTHLGKIKVKFVHLIFMFFTPQPLRAVGVLFSPMVSRWAGGRREKVCLGCISETVRCRKLILGRDIG